MWLYDRVFLEVLKCDWVFYCYYYYYYYYYCYLCYPPCIMHGVEGDLVVIWMLKWVSHTLGIPCLRGWVTPNRVFLGSFL